MLPPLLIDTSGPVLTRDEADLLTHPAVVGVTLFRRNLPNLAAARDLIDAIHAAANRALVIATDQEGGGVVRLLGVPTAPSAMALGAVDDPTLTERLGGATGRGLRRIGVNVDFAPVADVNADPRNPIIADRAFGGDAALVARHVAAFTRGLQASGVAATLKHFPGHGDVAIDSHLALPTLHASRSLLETREWQPFRAGIAAGAAAVMTGHLLTPALDPQHPATLSPTTLRVLRVELGFTGVIFSDALDMQAISGARGLPQAAVAACAAGVDVPVVCNRDPGTYHATLAALETATREGSLDPERIHAAHARVAALLRAYPSRVLTPDPAIHAADEAAEAEAALRAITRFGVPPRLRRGARILVASAGADTQTGVGDPAQGVTAFARALDEVGFRVDTVTLPALAGTIGSGFDALLIVTSERRPLSDDAVNAYRAAIATGVHHGIPTLHVAIWNPAHVARLPTPALASYGFRESSLRALARVLLRLEGDFGAGPADPPPPG